MHHTVAYMATVATVAETDLTPVNDGIMTIQNGHFLPQQDMYLKYAFAGGLFLNRARIITPSFRVITPPYIRPINLGLLPLTITPVADYIAHPLKLAALEEVEVAGVNSAATSGVYTVILGLGVEQQSVAPQGDVFTMRGVGTTTANVNQWTGCAITWSDILPRGLYACVGLVAIGATARAARLIFQGQSWRPGCVANTLVSDYAHQMFRHGKLGMWGQFIGTTLPTIEFLCGAADTAQEVYLDLVRIG